MEVFTMFQLYNCQISFPDYENSPLPTNFSRFTEPDSDSNIRFIDAKSKSTTAFPTIAQGTLLKLVERVTYHKYTGKMF